MKSELPFHAERDMRGLHHHRRARRRALVAAIGLAAAIALATPSRGAEPADNPWLSELSAISAWEGDEAAAAEVPPAETAFEPSAQEDDAETSAEFDPNFALVQAQAQAPLPAVSAPRTARSYRTVLRRPAAAGAGLSTLASIPYMMGDTGAGTCIGFSGLLEADLNHPTLACGRLNISEANSPLPQDRFYYSYRHYHNSSKVTAYTLEEVLDYDQHILGWENTFWDRTGSLEIRVPIEDRLRSDIISVVAPNFGVVDALVAPRDGRSVELGNMSLIFKMLLWERPNFAMSGGVGVTLPTAQDVNYQLVVDGQITFPDFPGLTANEQAAFQAVFANEMVYIAPFLAWVVAPPSRWFHQGFLQFETAANPSRVTINGDGATLFLQNSVPVGFYDYFTPVPVRAELFAQPLMRLNLNWGYILAQGQHHSRPSQLAALFELHYTTTLADANLTDVPLTALSSIGTVPLQAITVGNANNRVDIVNAGAGVQGRWGQWILSNGLVVPLRDAPDRGFDCEYNLQLQRLF
jgi:hypothetical protein